MKSGPIWNPLKTTSSSPEERVAMPTNRLPDRRCSHRARPRSNSRGRRGCRRSCRRSRAAAATRWGTPASRPNPWRRTLKGGAHKSARRGSRFPSSAGSVGGADTSDKGVPSSCENAPVGAMLPDLRTGLSVCRRADPVATSRRTLGRHGTTRAHPRQHKNRRGGARAGPSFEIRRPAWQESGRKRKHGKPHALRLHLQCLFAKDRAQAG